MLLILRLGLFNMHHADILVIEDNETEALLIETVITKAMPQDNVHVINDGAKALDFLNGRPPYEDAPLPHLILVDLKMPWCDGFEFLKIVKTDEKLRSIPVIVLTSSDSKDDIEKSYDLGANCFIHKPDSPAKMQALVTVINHFWLDVVRLPHSPTKVAAG